MKKNLLLIILCLGGLLAKSQTTEEENTLENTPHNGDATCARPQIVTNPFAPQNTEWNTMRNRFNWMDYVTWHKEKS